MYLPLIIAENCIAVLLLIKRTEKDKVFIQIACMWEPLLMHCLHKKHYAFQIAEAHKTSDIG